MRGGEFSRLYIALVYSSKRLVRLKGNYKCLKTHAGTVHVQKFRYNTCRCMPVACVNPNTTALSEESNLTVDEIIYDIRALGLTEILNLILPKLLSTANRTLSSLSKNWIHLELSAAWDVRCASKMAGDAVNVRALVSGLLAT